jgi:hypothetical protein
VENNYPNNKCNEIICLAKAVYHIPVHNLKDSVKIYPCNENTVAKLASHVYDSVSVYFMWQHCLDSGTLHV